MWILSAMAVALQLLLLLRWPGPVEAYYCTAVCTVLNLVWILCFYFLHTCLLTDHFWLYDRLKQKKQKDTSWKSLKLRQCRLAHIAAAAAAYVTAWRRHLAATLRIWTFSHQKKIWEKHSLTTEGMRTMQVYTEWKHISKHLKERFFRLTKLRESVRVSIRSIFYSSLKTNFSGPSCSFSKKATILQPWKFCCCPIKWWKVIANRTFGTFKHVETPQEHILKGRLC